MPHVCRNRICDMWVAWVLGRSKMVYWSWSDRRHISPVSVCGGVVAMVMIGESARWRCGPLLKNFGHRGALELILQSVMYQSRGALDLKNFLRYLRSVPHLTVIKKKKKTMDSIYP